MKTYKDVKSYSVTWLANTYDKDTLQGTIANYYLPETIEGLPSCVGSYTGKTKSFMS